MTGGFIKRLLVWCGLVGALILGAVVREVFDPCCLQTVLMVILGLVALILGFTALSPETENRNLVFSEEWTRRILGPYDADHEEALGDTIDDEGLD